MENRPTNPQFRTAFWFAASDIDPALVERLVGTESTPAGICCRLAMLFLRPITFILASRLITSKSCCKSLLGQSSKTGLGSCSGIIHVTPLVYPCINHCSLTLL